MDETLEEYFFRTAATDLFRRVSHLEIQLGANTSLPLADIIEAEARARCLRILDDHIEIRAKQIDIKKALTEWSMRANEIPKLDGEFPI